MLSLHMSAACMAAWLLTSNGSLLAAQEQLPDSSSVPPRVAVGRAVHISTDAPTSAHAESFLAINPRNMQNLIATAMVATGGHLHSVVYASLDGGHTWMRGRTPDHDRPVRPNWSDWDPVVYFDDSGTAFFAHVVADPSIPRPDSTIVLSRSRDGGRTWDPGILIPVLIDREFFAFDRTSGPFHGRMYVVGVARGTWLDGTKRNAIGVGYSTDGGRSFGGWRTLLPDTNWPVWGTSDPIVTPQGTLVIPFLVLEPKAFGRFDTASDGARRGQDAVRHGYLMTVASRNGGHSFSPARRGPSVAVATVPYRFLASLPAPRAAIDRSSGPYRGRIYLTWTNYVDGRYLVLVTHSDDVAKTWSHPVVVNDNDDEGGDPATPTIAVNRYGVVAVMWNDRRDDPANRCYQLYVAVSTDGGETFQPNVRASDRWTCPADAGNTSIGTVVSPLQRRDDRWVINVMLQSIRSRWPNGGDTQGLVSDGAGVFHAAWIGTRDGVMQLMAHRFVVNARAVPAPTPTANRPDLSEALTLEVMDADVDFASRTISMTMRLVNAGRAVVDGPFMIALDTVASQLAGVRVTNADNGLPGPGAAWSVPASGERLLPGATSGSRMMTWSFRSVPRQFLTYIQTMRFSILRTEPQHSARRDQ